MVNDNKADESKKIQTAVLENPWKNAYWFARMFINSDKYGGIGKETKLLSEMGLALPSFLPLTQ